MEEVINAYFHGMADIIGFATSSVLTFPLAVIGFMFYCIPLIGLGYAAFQGLLILIAVARGDRSWRL